MALRLGDPVPTASRKRLLSAAAALQVPPKPDLLVSRLLFVSLSAGRKSKYGPVAAARWYSVRRLSARSRYLRLALVIYSRLLSMGEIESIFRTYVALNDLLQNCPNAVHVLYLVTKRRAF